MPSTDADPVGDVLPVQRSLYRLPVEILVMVFEHLEDELVNEARTTTAILLCSAAFRTLHASLTTSKLLNNLATQVFRRTVVISNPDQHRRVQRAIRKNPDLAKAVRCLVFFEHELPRRDEQPLAIQRNPVLMAAMGSLKKRKRSSRPWYEVKKKKSTPAANEVALSHTMMRIWRTVHHNAVGINGEELIPQLRANCDTVLNVVDLCLNLSNLEVFRFVGLHGRVGDARFEPWPRMRTGFQSLFVTVMNAISPTELPDLSARLFRNLQDLELFGFNNTITWANFARSILSLPNLHTLRLSRPVDFDASTTGNSLSSSSSTIRRLLISSPGTTIKNTTAILAAIDRLEALHFTPWPPLQLIGDFDQFHRATQRHRRTLKELRIRENEFFTISPIPGVTWSDFSELTVLDIPENLLYDNDTTVPMLVAKFPPHLETLGVVLYLKKKVAPGLLVKLAEHKELVPHLKEVNLFERPWCTDEMKDRLQGLENLLASNGLVLRYDRV
ncbi:hypothetical protein BDW62DRAFT_200180 [Aspergillus aurantiobrunneus]